MVPFIARRFVVLLLTLLAVSVLCFALPYLSEGDPARSILRARVSDLAIDPDAVEGLKARYGLDRPLPVQYASWIANVARGDFGYSFAKSDAGRRPDRKRPVGVGHARAHLARDRDRRRVSTRHRGRGPARRAGQTTS